MSRCFSLKDIIDIDNDGYVYRLDESTIDLLAQISHSLSSSAKRVRSQPQWESLRIKPKQREEKPTGAIYDANDVLRSTLNKLTEKTFLENVDKIVDIFKTNKSQTEQLNDTLFEMCNTNRCFSKLYADLYTTIINEVPSVKAIFSTKLPFCIELMTTRFDRNIDDETESYEEICKRSEANDYTRNMACFFVHLHTNGIVANQTIVETCCAILLQILTFLQQPDYHQSIDLAVDILEIFYIPKLLEKTTVTIDGKKTKVKSVLQKLAETENISDFKSLSNKTLFKLMDIVGL